MSGYEQPALSGFISFVLPYDAAPEQALAAISAIQKHFNLAAPAGIVGTALSGGVAVQVGTPIVGQMIDPGATTATSETPALDKNGLPWDERIHSSSKGMNQDGTWRNKKGCPPQLRTKVEAELRAAMGATAPVDAATPVLAAPSLPPPPALAQPQLPMPPAAPVVTPFNEFVQFIAAETWSDANPNGRLTADWVKQSLTNYGVPNGDIQNLAHNEELCKQIHAAIKNALGQ